MNGLGHQAGRATLIPGAKAACAWLAVALAGCAIQPISQENDAVASTAQSALGGMPQSRPVARVHKGAFLLGEKVAASKSQPGIYDRRVVWNDSRPVSLQQVSTWIAHAVRVPVDIEPSASVPLSGASAAPAMEPLQSVTAGGGPLPAGGISGGMPGMGGMVMGAARLPSGLATQLGGVPTSSGALPSVVLPRYEGSLRGFLDVVSASFQQWSRYRDGRLSFFRTETRTFTLPAIADAATMTGQISTGQGGASSSGGGGGSAGSGGSSGQSATMTVSVSPWATLKQTATAIAGVPVVVDENLGVMTVTGTPTQCDRLEAWYRDLKAMFGKQVAIDVHVYQIRRTTEDNYGLNLKLAYTNASGHTGLSFSSAQVPTLISAAAPMNFGATILSGPLAGSSAAMQALSTLGRVSEVVSDSGVTQNGKKLSLQAATLQDFVQQSTTTITPNVGTTTSLLTATAVPGFTSNFLPKVVDGQILLDFDMTLSDLLPLQTFSAGSGGSQTSVQLRTMPTARFQQHVGLKPGETLVLTGMRQQTTSVTNNGVGTPGMALLGGGVDAQKTDTILAVVITARTL